MQFVSKGGVRKELDIQGVVRKELDIQCGLPARVESGWNQTFRAVCQPDQETKHSAEPVWSQDGTRDPRCMCGTPASDCQGETPSATSPPIGEEITSLPALAAS